MAAVAEDIQDTAETGLAEGADEAEDAEGVEEKKVVEAQHGEDLTIYTLKSQLLSVDCLFSVELSGVSLRADAFSSSIELSDLNSLIRRSNRLATRILPSTLTNSYLFPYYHMPQKKQGNVSAPMLGPWVLKHVALNIASQHNAKHIISTLSHIGRMIQQVDKSRNLWRSVCSDCRQALDCSVSLKPAVEHVRDHHHHPDRQELSLCHYLACQVVIPLQSDLRMHLDGCGKYILSDSRPAISTDQRESRLQGRGGFIPGSLW
jgi:hypothetical protein